jgi:uncharacterized membrane protein YgdD (TMEM256/DUF423 family)
MNKSALLLGCIFAMTSVVLGAFGAHYLKTIFTPELLTSFETGVRYQFYHGIALLVAGLLQGFIKNSLRWVVLLFASGVVLFSGSIYALCMLKSNGSIGLSGLGLLTPIGGVFFITAWGILLVELFRLKSKF